MEETMSGSQETVKRDKVFLLPQQEHDQAIVSKKRGLCSKLEQKKTTGNTGRAPPVSNDVCIYG